MKANIIERGRGPEIEGTRITVYHIMDYVRAGLPAEEMATDYRVDLSQVQAALDYIEAHRPEVEREYDKIMARIRQGNPPWVDAMLAQSPEELKQRLDARMKANGYAHNGRS